MHVAQREYDYAEVPLTLFFTVLGAGFHKNTTIYNDLSF